MKSFDGYDFSQVGFPERYGAQDFVFHGQTGRGKTHLAITVSGQLWRPAAACGSSRRPSWSCSWRRRSGRAAWTGTWRT